MLKLNRLLSIAVDMGRFRAVHTSADQNPHKLWAPHDNSIDINC